MFSSSRSGRAEHLLWMRNHFDASLRRQRGRKDSMRNEILTALPEISRVLSVDLKFITPRVFGFHLKIIFLSFCTHNPPQKCRWKQAALLTGWFPRSHRSLLSIFYLISSRCTVKSRKLHRLIMPLITLDDWINPPQPFATIRHAVSGFWLSPGTRDAIMGMSSEKHTFWKV